MNPLTIVLPRRLAELMCLRRLIALKMVEEAPLHVWSQLYAAVNFHEAPPYLVVKESISAVPNQTLQDLLQEYEFFGFEVCISGYIPEDETKIYTVKETLDPPTEDIEEIMKNYEDTKPRDSMDSIKRYMRESSVSDILNTGL